MTNIDLDLDVVVKYEPRYEDQPPYLKKFWDICETLLKMGIKPTPSVINQALGKPTRNSLNGRQCNIKNYLLDKYGYKFEERQGLRRPYYRWVKQ